MKNKEKYMKSTECILRIIVSRSRYCCQENCNFLFKKRSHSSDFLRNAGAWRGNAEKTFPLDNLLKRCYDDLKSIEKC